MFRAALWPAFDGHRTEVRTSASFAKPGLYKLWAQFQRRGEVITVPIVSQVK